MGENSSQTTIEGLNLSEEDMQTRDKAITWVKDAIDAYAAESRELHAPERADRVRSTGQVAVAPSITTAPDHIRRGTEIDQAIWKAENAEEDDYQARLDEDDPSRVPTAAEIASERDYDDRMARDSKISEALHGDGTHTFGLNGQVEVLVDGREPYQGYKIGRDDVLGTAEPLAALQQQRLDAIAQELPDPLRSQMAEQYGV